MGPAGGADVIRPSSHPGEWACLPGQRSREEREWIVEDCTELSLP